MNTEEYCRAIEGYLCRKNDGHLIRIVGPSFERVCRWAALGIPFKVACHGIDQYFVRYYAKGPRRRPVQIDFCENDVMDAFDTWRRAVGVHVSGVDGADDAVTEEDAGPRSRRKSLPEHLDRVCLRITDRRAGVTPPPPELDSVLETVTSEAAAFRDLPKPIRGESRDRVLARLVELDRMMLDGVRAQALPDLLEAIRTEAAEQLSPFRGRMPADAYQRALDNAVDRLLREHERLPIVTFDGST